MSETNRLLEEILKELESCEVDFMAGKVSGDADKKMEEFLLGTSMDEIPDYKPESNEDKYYFYVDELIDRRNVSNQIHHVDFYQPMESGNFIKRTIRKAVRRLIAPIMEIVVLEQNKFNASIAGAVNMMCDNDAVVAEFVHEQQKLNQELRLLRREVEMLRKKNVEAQLEMINARKKLHRDIVLLREALTENIE